MTNLVKLTNKIMSSLNYYYDGCGTRFSHSVQILGFLLMSAILNRFGAVQAGYFC